MQCLCRPDLIPDAHKRIERDAMGRCGKEFDVQAALKVYNDYCASNGFPVPGYTYISTQTVRVSTGAGMATAGTPTITAGDGSGGSGGPFVTTATAKILTATATVFRSAGRPRCEPASSWPWMYLLSLVALVPILQFVSRIGVRAQMVVVTYTESPPPPASSLVVTMRETILTEPIVSTLRVTQTQAGNVEPGTTTAGSSRVSSNDDGLGGGGDNDSGSSTAGKGNLSQLEIAGIVIGIVFGIISALATLWMCMRGVRTQ